MSMAIVLALIVVGSVLFHLLSPWWTTPLASNWQRMDDTLDITLVICGLFFVVINLFLAYTVWRFSHRAGRPAPPRVAESRALERWLIVGTSIAIGALLAPGLLVYASYVRTPADAMVLEVLGQQWQWRFRLPGADGRLGASDARFVSADNAFGLDPKDAAAQDDLLVAAPEVHLPLNRPVRVLLRSHDVLHDFYVPPMRARMNMVPGQVGVFWFTPTKAGRFEALCSQLCGVGHADMRAVMVVEEQAQFDAWQKALPTFAATQDAAAPGGGPVGRTLAAAKGCLACHSVDGSKSVGPGWKGLAGKSQSYTDGSVVQLDSAALERAIREPVERIAKGYAAVMPKADLTDAEVAALVDYIEGLK